MALLSRASLCCLLACLLLQGCPRPPARPGRGTPDAGALPGSSGPDGGSPHVCRDPASHPVGQSPLLWDRYGFYPRVVRLAHGGALNGTLVATVVENMDNAWVGAMFHSQDDGQSFEFVGKALDPEQSTGMCCHTLFELPSPVGGMPAGTLLWAASLGADVPDRRMAEKVWKSSDQGRTWTYLSTVSRSTTAQGTWEPELTVSKDGHLVIFYSDETDPAHSQKLVAWRSTDGVTWTDSKDVVAAVNPALRPGMANVRRLPDGRYAMSYEVCSTDNSHVCEVHLRYSPDGWDWGDPTDLGLAVQTADGKFPASTPTLSLAGNTLLVNAMRLRNADLTFAPEEGTVVLGNASLGQGPWFEVNAPVHVHTPPNNWSNPLLGSDDGKSVFEIGTDLNAAGALRPYVGTTTVAPLGVGPDGQEGSSVFVRGGVLHVFGRTPGGELEHWSRAAAGGPVSTERLGSAVVGQPVGFLDGPEGHVFARSSAGQLEHFWSAADAFTSHDLWFLGGLAADPAAMRVGDAQHAWAVDTGGVLQHQWWNPTSGSAHDTWAQGVQGRPSAMLVGGVQHLVARSSAGLVEHLWWNAFQGFQHETVGMGHDDAGQACALFQLEGDPAVAEVGDAQHLWAVDASGALEHLWWNPNQGWQRDVWAHGVTGRPALLLVDGGQHVFIRAADGTLAHAWWSPGQPVQEERWSPGAPLAFDPGAVDDGTNRHVFATDGSGALHHWQWAAGGAPAHETWSP